MRRRRVHSIARVVAVVAACLAVAEGIRWANRWYVSTMFGASGEPGMAADVLAKAHDALVHGLGWLAVALVAAAVGWRLRITRRHGGREMVG